jgi:hypothetical protein
MIPSIPTKNTFLFIANSLVRGLPAHGLEYEKAASPLLGDDSVLPKKMRKYAIGGLTKGYEVTNLLACGGWVTDICL